MITRHAIRYRAELGHAASEALHAFRMRGSAAHHVHRLRSQRLAMERSSAFEAGTELTAGRPATDLALQEPEAEYSASLLLDLFGGDTKLLREVVGLFLRDCPGRLSDVRDAVGRRDGTTLARVAHCLKGSAANFAADLAVAAAQRLQLIGRTGDWAEVDQALADLETEIENLTSTLQAFA
jgi:HPt (histidine-containing phosphotransfer) domain-containing protein